MVDNNSKKRKAPDSPQVDDDADNFERFTQQENREEKEKKVKKRKQENNLRTPKKNDNELQNTGSTPAPSSVVSNPIAPLGNHIVLDSVISGLHKIVEKVDTETEEVTYSSGLEAADLIAVLKFLNASNDKLEEIGQSARKGAMLFEVGYKKIAEGKKMVKEAFDQIPQYTKNLSVKRELKY